jgi:hypothetical protein
MSNNPAATVPANLPAETPTAGAAIEPAAPVVATADGVEASAEGVAPVAPVVPKPVVVARKRAAKVLSKPVAAPVAKPVAKPAKSAQAAPSVKADPVTVAAKTVAKTARPATTKLTPKAAAKAEVQPKTKPVVQVAAKPTTKPTAKPTKAPKAAAAAKPAAKVAKKLSAKAPVAKPSDTAAAGKVTRSKEKLVRDSFTMPRADFALIHQLKERGLGFKRAIRKSELLRAGLQALAAMDDALLKALLDRLPALKAGRPRKAG